MNNAKYAFLTSFHMSAYFALDSNGLEMYESFFTSLDADYLDQVGEAISKSGFVMPMLCCSPDFTNPGVDAANERSSGKRP